MSYFYVQVCPNGHFRITNKKLQSGAVCEACGLPLMDKCPECGEYVKKWTLYGATPILPGKDAYELPALCGKCGSKFPWGGENHAKKPFREAEGSGEAQPFRQDGISSGAHANTLCCPDEQDGIASGLQPLRQNEASSGAQLSPKGSSPDYQFLLADMRQANGEAALVRKAYDEAGQKEYETCSYAFFPGCQLGAAEPEIVIKAYDSIRFQHPDTAMFLQCCGFAADMAGNHSSFETVLDGIKEKWASLGKPTMIMACPACQGIFQTHLPDVPVISLYKILQDMGVSGGCHSEDFIFLRMGADAEGGVGAPNAEAKLHPGNDSNPIVEAVRALAEDMGAKLHFTEEGKAAKYPYIVCSINQRDQLKREGKEAVHILELIFGMGESNLHLEHEHSHGHGDDHASGNVCGHICESADGNESEDLQAIQTDEMEQELQPGKEERSALKIEPGNGSVPATASKTASKPADAPVPKSGVAPALIDAPCLKPETASALLPSTAERWQNRLELKQTLLEFFWNESHE